MKPVHLYETAPSGMIFDNIFITEVPNADNSGFEYLIEYQGMDIEKKIDVGQFSLITGDISFLDTHYRGISHTALRLLVDWIEKNMEK